MNEVNISEGNVMKVICPFCKEEVMGEDEPSYGSTATGGKYVCHKKICRNKDKHPDHNNIAVVFKPEVTNERA